MEEIFNNAPSRKLNKGQILIYEGDDISNIFLLSSGYVKVFHIHATGTQQTIIIYAPGEPFPLVGFLSGQGVARYFYECMTDVELKVMPQREFQEKIRGNWELGEKLITYGYILSNQFTERIETLSAHRSHEKLAALLSYLADKAGEPSNGKTRLSLPLTTQEIADMCGLTRETASMQLQRMKREGIVSGRRNLVINPRKLAKIIQG